jgi:hypothetical protein
MREKTEYRSRQIQPKEPHKKGEKIHYEKKKREDREEIKGQRTKERQDKTKPMLFRILWLESIPTSLRQESGTRLSPVHRLPFAIIIIHHERSIDTEPYNGEED